MLLERQIWLRCYLLFFEVEVEGFPACFSDFVNGILGDDLDALFDVNGGVLVVSAAVGLGTIGGGIGDFDFCRRGAMVALRTCFSSWYW